MKACALAFALLSTAAIAQDKRETFEARDVRIAERVELGDDIALIPLSIWEDSRCEDRRLCFGENRFIIDAMLTERGQDRKFPMEMGVAYPVAGGTLALVDAGVPANDDSAIALFKYRFRFVLKPGSQ